MSIRIAGHRGRATAEALIAAVVTSATVGHDILVMLGGEDDGEPGDPAVLVVDVDSVAIAAEGVRVVTVGYSSSADFAATDIRVSLDGTDFALLHDGTTTPVHLSLVGERHVVPALAAIAVAVEAGSSVTDAAAALARIAHAGSGNLELRPLDGRVTVIDDSADRSTASSIEALKTLAEITGPENRSIAIVGELDGPVSGTPFADPIESRDEHDRLGRIVVRLNIGLLVAIGPGARHLQAAAGLEGSWDGESVLVGTPEEAYDLVRDRVRPGDIILVSTPPGAHAQTDTHPLDQRLGRLHA